MNAGSPRTHCDAAAAAVRLPRRPTRVAVRSFGPAESSAASWNREIGPQDDTVGADVLNDS